MTREVIGSAAIEVYERPDSVVILPVPLHDAEITRRLHAIFPQPDGWLHATYAASWIRGKAPVAQFRERIAMARAILRDEAASAGAGK